MTHPKPIALRCRISRGGFSGERIVDIPLAAGGTYRAIAPHHYCWTREGRGLQGDEPARGQAIDGLVAARWLQEELGNRAVVSVPDGETLVVPAEALTGRPTAEGVPHVPLGP
jgi:hypothetical protein